MKCVIFVVVVLDVTLRFLAYDKPVKRVCHMLLCVCVCVSVCVCSYVCVCASLRDEANSQRSAGLCVIHRDLRESPSHPSIVDKRPPRPTPQPASHVNTRQQDPMDLRAVSVLSHVLIPSQPRTLGRAMTTKRAMMKQDPNGSNNLIMPLGFALVPAARNFPCPPTCDRGRRAGGGGGGSPCVCSGLKLLLWDQICWNKEGQPGVKLFQGSSDWLYGAFNGRECWGTRTWTRTWTWTWSSRPSISTFSLEDNVS